MSYSPPKYYLISNKIINEIKNGKLKTGDQIPSENELIIKFNISNTTARKVLQEIQMQGFARKIRGKGTFVENIFVDRSATKILSFTKNMKEFGLIPTTKLLGSEIIDEDINKVISQKLYILKKPCLKIVRLRYANNIPMMVEERFISLKLCNGIEKFDLETSLYDLYKNNFRLKISRIEQSLSSILLDVTSQKIFELKAKSTGIKVEGVTFHGKNDIIEIENSIYRGDKYKFYIEARE